MDKIKKKLGIWIKLKSENGKNKCELINIKSKCSRE